MYSMNSYLSLVLFAWVTLSLSQKYRKIDVITNNTYNTTAMSSNQDYLIFEIKTCRNSDISFLKNNFRFYFLILRHQPGLMTVSIRKNDETSPVVEKSISVTGCNGFRKYKFGWRRENVSLWTLTSTGWDLLVDWQDPLPVLHGYDSCAVWSRSAEWKLYQIEHSTKPVRVTCVNF